MDKRYPRPVADTSPSSNDITTATHDAEDPRRLVTRGSDPRMPVASQAALPGIPKQTIIGTPQEDVSPETGIIRESWVSFASTAASRDSGVPSIFSVRASTASAATRYSVRQSSIESPISATSPMHQGHRKSSYPHGPQYCCTFCDEAFDSNTEWKLHEFEFHDRRERYRCRSCPAVFPRAALFSEHLKADHGLDIAESMTTIPVEYGPIRSAWGCGFCGAVTLSRTDYLDHVGEHYDEGKELVEWQHTRVIEALLHQPKVASAWMALVAKEEHARGAKLRFLWDPHTTGRSTDEREPQRLQDMLELFVTGTRGAEEIAAVAYNSAHIRLEGNVSDLISKLYLRNPDPKPRKSNPNPAQHSPELQPCAPGATDDVVSPMSPLPAPLRPPTAPPRISDPLPRPPRFQSQSPALSSSPSVSELAGVGPLAFPRFFKPSSLRRIESSRSLGISQNAGAVNSLDRQGITMLPPMGSFDVPPISIRGTAEPLPRALGTPERPFSAGDQRPTLALGLNTTSSVKPHTSSSTLSTHTRDSSHEFGDSTSEVVSDDSLSEPDSWLDPGGVPTATKIWRNSFQQTVDRGMRQLWLQYNHDWDALVRQCVGEKRTDSMQYRESSGRVRKAASSRYTPSKGFRPNGKSLGQEDDEEDDEREGYQPSSSLSKRSPESAKRFACPFRKHDPNTYNLQDHEVCAIRSWSTISRLKEHLYRRHYKIHCQRCKRIFSDSRELAEHEMLAMGCEVLDIIPPGDITTYQEKQLKSRKHTTRRQTDEEKWRDIYRLLFPNEEIPSPYPRLPRTWGPQPPSPKTAEEHAGRRLQSHEGLALEAIPGIIQDALQKAFRAWEAKGSALPTREASVASMSFLPETPTSLAYSFGQPTAYQTPQPAATIDHAFPQGHFNNTRTDFSCEIPHASHADDSGFAEDNFFTSGPPVNFNTFAPQYERGPWEPGLGLMGVGSLEPDLNMGSHFPGFQDG